MGRRTQPQSDLRRRRTLTVAGVAAAAAAVSTLAVIDESAGHRAFVVPTASRGSSSSAATSDVAALDYLEASVMVHSDVQAETTFEATIANWWRSLSVAGAAALCALVVGTSQPNLREAPTLTLGSQPAYAAGSYASGQRTNKDPVSLLQYALPLEETLGEKKVEKMREVQRNIEGAKADALLRLWAKASGKINDATQEVSKNAKDLLKPVDAARQPAAEKKLNELKALLPKLSKQLELGGDAGAGTERDREAAKEALALCVQAQALVGDVEELYVPDGYKTPVADDVDKTLPRLEGRASVEFIIKRGDTGESKTAQKFDVDAELFEEAKIKCVVDGWTAPVSAGAWLEMVDKGFYTGMTIQRADGFIIQTGDPGKEKKNGYIPPGATKVRRLPLEVGIKGRKMALYSETIDEANVVGEEPKIPFQADGTLAIARNENDNDSASSQFFMFLFESDMTPAGKNFLDGRYSTFGYTVEGEKFLRQVKEGDVITSAKVLSGKERLKLTAPAAAAPAAPAVEVKAPAVAVKT